MRQSRIVGRVHFPDGVVIGPYFVFRVGDDDDFTQDFIELIASGLLISSPLDEDIETQRLDSSPGLVPRALLEQLIIPSMTVPDMGQDRQLNSAGKGNVGLKADALALGPRLLRNVLSLVVACFIWIGEGYPCESMLNNHLAVSVRDTGKEIPQRGINLHVIRGLGFGNGLGFSVRDVRCLLQESNDIGSGFLHNGFVEVVPDSVHLAGVAVRDVVGMGVLKLVSLVSCTVEVYRATDRDDVDLSTPLAGQFFASRRQLGVANWHEFASPRGISAVSVLCQVSRGDISQA